MPVPRCAARRRDGRECGALVSTPTATYCRRHEQLAAELGDDAVQTGGYARRRVPRDETPLIIEETQTAAPVPTIDGTAISRPRSDLAWRRRRPSPSTRSSWRCGALH
jgi:hypothetical protein